MSRKDGQTSDLRRPKPPGRGRDGPGAAAAAPASGPRVLLASHGRLSSSLSLLLLEIDFYSKQTCFCASFLGESCRKMVSPEKEKLLFPLKIMYATHMSEEEGGDA